MLLSFDNNVTAAMLVAQVRKSLVGPPSPTKLSNPMKSTSVPQKQPALLLSSLSLSLQNMKDRTSLNIQIDGQMQANHVVAVEPEEITNLIVQENDLVQKSVIT